MGYPLPHPSSVTSPQSRPRGTRPGIANDPLRSDSDAPHSGSRLRQADFAGQPQHISYNRPVHAQQDQGIGSVGRYRLFSEIAAGGMATVHLGHHLSQTRTPGQSLHPYSNVAIKRLHAQYTRDEEFVTMFADETRLVTHIHHPNVVQTLDVVHDKGELSLVMEYVHGESFSKLLSAAYRAGHPATPSIIRTVMVDVLRGLHGAHEATDESGNPLQIVHRDVSPQNIIVGADGIARVLDFGIAKAIGRASITRDNEVRGKIAYMAPEQLHRAGLDRRTDIYAASIIMWEALSCKRLFHASNEAATLARVMNLNVTPPSHHRAGVSPQMDAVVLRGLSRDPAHRYQTAWDMAQALAASGRCASREELAEWVQTVAAEKLRERAHLVSLMQAQIPLSADAAPNEITGVRKTYPNASHMAPLTVAPELQQVQLSPTPAKSRLVPRSLLAAGTLVVSIAIGGLLSSRIPDTWLTALPWVNPSPNALPNGAQSGDAQADDAQPNTQPPATTQALPSQNNPASEARPGEPPESSDEAVTTGQARPASGPLDTRSAPGLSESRTQRAHSATASAKASRVEATRAVSATPGKQASQRAASPAEPKAPASLNCDPPFTIDESGTRRYKMACL